MLVPMSAQVRCGMLVAVGLSPLAAELGRSEHTGFGAGLVHLFPPVETHKVPASLLVTTWCNDFFLLILGVFTFFYPWFAASSRVL